MDGRTDGHMGGHLRPTLLGRLSGVNLIKKKKNNNNDDNQKQQPAAAARYKIVH